MISENLKPHLLPRRRLNKKQQGLILFGFALLFLGFWFVSVETTTFIIIALGVSLIAARSFDYSFSILFGLSMGVSYDLLLSYRPSFGGFSLPITPLDLMLGLVIIASVLNLTGRKDSFALPKYIRAPYTIFAIMTLFGLIYGIAANSGSLYTYFKDFRLFFALHLSILGIAWFIRKPEQLRLFANVIVIAGLVCAVQQIERIFLGGGQDVKIRDVSLPTQILPVAIMILIIYRHHRISIKPSNFHALYIALMLVAIVLSFTRTVWAMMVLSYLIGLRYKGSRQRSRSLILGFAFVAILISVIPFINKFSSQGVNFQEIINTRVQSLVNQNDVAAESRIVASVSAWGIFIQSPIWGMGIGYPIYVYDIEERSMVEAQLLHNSALYYGIKIGSIGLLSLIWLIIAGSMNAFRIANEEKANESTRDREVKAFAQSMISGMIPLILIGPWSGNLNYFPFMMPLGLFIGLNWEKVMASAR